MFWTMTTVVSIKYVLLILRADNNGEGGLIAMLALASQAVKDRPRLRNILLAVGIFGLGGPLISIGSPKLVSQWFGPAERGRAMGIIITGVAVGSILSLTLTHSVLMPLFHGNWRHVMLAYAGAMLFATLLWALVNLHPAARLGMTTVLVGAHAAASTADFVHHRTNDLAGFLTLARLKDL